MKRRIALITAIFMLVFSLPVFGADFKDMPQEDSKFYDAFVYAINKKLISGDGVNLNPHSYITQAEALTIISRIKPFDCEETDITVFGVSKDKWYYSTVAKAYTLGYVTADTLSPERAINRISANNIIGKVYGKTPTPWPSNESCTRADFIWEIYFQAPDGKNAVAQVPTETVSEAPTEPATEFSDLKAKAAQEAMQVALGILPDGTVYSKVAAYRDESQEDWGGGSGSGGSSSSRPSRPTEPKDDDDDEEDEEPSTEDTGSEVTPTDPSTEPPTEPPTEPETPEPTYGEYDGPIDNDKDNVIDDPFDDGWRPPGWGGDDNDEGQGGYDEEDDFDINDADDPDYVEPTQDESTNPTEPETDEPTDEESTNPSEDETDEPTDGESTNPSEDETDEPTDEESTNPSADETDEPTDGESTNPSEDVTLPPESEDESDETDNAENSDDLTTGGGDNNTEEAILLSKEW